MDKKLLGNYSSLVWLEGTRQIKGSFNDVRKATHLLKNSDRLLS